MRDYNLPLENLEEKQDIEDVPNIRNFEILKNDDLNFTIQRKSIYNFFGFVKLIFDFIVSLFFFIFFFYFLNNFSNNFFIIYMIFCGVFYILGYAIYNVCKNPGVHISIDSFQIAISKLQFVNSKPSNPKNIKIDRNITIGINEKKISSFKVAIARILVGNIFTMFSKKANTTSTDNIELNNFELLLYKKDDYNFKKSRIVLIDRITKKEAEYLVNKILQVANKYDKKISVENAVVEQDNSFKFIFAILLAMLFIVGIPYITSRMHTVQKYTIKEPEVLDSNVLNYLGYTYTEGNIEKDWKKDEQPVDSINIPSSYKYKKQEYQIKEIGDKCFSFSTKLKQVSLPEGLTTIGESAFSECVSLKEIKIPDSVNKIYKYAFVNCYALTNVHIPKNINRIEENVFFRCTSLTNFVIPDNIEIIGYEAFGECSNLKEIKIPKSVRIIRSGVFLNCKSLEKIDIPNSVTEIGSRIFYSCTSLKDVKLPDSLTEIGNQAFWGCTSLKEIKLPDSVTEIEKQTFESCTSLQNIYIPKSVTKIGNRAFENCTSLNIKVPDSVTKIGQDAFLGVPHVEYHGKATGAPWGAKKLN